MATATATRTPRPFTCSFIAITIEITDVRYSVDPIPAGEFGTAAYRLTKHGRDAATYDVIRTHDGLIECTCPDHVYRRQGNTAEPCRHGRALAALGLMAAPTPMAPGTGTWDLQSPAYGSAESAEFGTAVGPPPCCTSLLERGLELAQAEATNAPVALPDRYEDEAPEVDDDEAFDFDEFEDPMEFPPDDVWELGPDPQDVLPADDPAVIAGELDARGHLDHSERLTLAELVERQVKFYEGWENAAGRMFAAAMAELLLKVELTQATTPAEFEARAELLDADARQQWETIGYEAGLAAGRREGTGHAGPLD